MTLAQLQVWLNARGAGLVVDGMAGPATRAAVLAAFTNRSAPAVTAADLDRVAVELGCSVRQLAAVAAVESAGSGFDAQGRPKILFERHKFYALTGGRWGVCAWSNPSGGGYDTESWGKLLCAVGCDPEAAFASASWGKFQVMGFHAHALGFASALELAYSTVASEAAHYELLARFISVNGLRPALAALSSDPETCRKFARRYNGRGYEANRYHLKLAQAMRGTEACR